MAEMKWAEFDNETETAIELLAETITYNADQRRRIESALRCFLRVAWRGPIQ